MILFTILLIALAVLTTIILTFGGATVLVFGDVIVFIWLMAIIFKAIFKKKEK